MSLPYLPLFVDDFEADTAHLTLIEDGIYNRILRLCWRTPKCRMPNDHDWIARKIRISSDDEMAAMKAILNEFFSVRRGYIFSKRLSAEYERIRVSIQKRKNAGQTGGRSKSLKNKERDSSNARAMLKHPYPEPEPEPDEKTNVFSKREGARKKTRSSNWVSPRTHTDAAIDFIQELSDEQEGNGSSGEITSGNVPLLSAIGASRR